MEYSQACLFAPPVSSQHMLTVDQPSPSLPLFHAHSHFLKFVKILLVSFSWLPGGGGISLGNVSHSWQLGRAAGANWARQLHFLLSFLFYSVDWQPALWEAGQSWSCGLPTLLKSFAELAQSCTEWTCAECSWWIPHKGKQGLFPPVCTSEWERGQILAWVDNGVSACGERSNFLSQQVRQENCPLTQGGSCQNKHIGDNVSQLLFSLSCSWSRYFPPLPFRHFLSYVCQQQHRGHYFKDKTLWCGWMSAYDGPFQNMLHCHNG